MSFLVTVTGCIYKETAKRIVTEGTNDENNENASPSHDHEVQYQTIAEFDKFHVWEHDEEPCTKSNLIFKTMEYIRLAKTVSVNACDLTL